MNEKTKLARIATITAIVKEAEIIAEDVKTEHAKTKKKAGEWLLNTNTNTKQEAAKNITQNIIELDSHARTIEQMATYTRNNLEAAQNGDTDALYFAPGNYAEMNEALAEFENAVNEINNTINNN